MVTDGAMWNACDVEARQSLARETRYGNTDEYVRKRGVKETGTFHPPRIFRRMIMRKNVDKEPILITGHAVIFEGISYINPVISADDLSETE